MPGSVIWTEVAAWSRSDDGGVLSGLVMMESSRGSRGGLQAHVKREGVGVDLWV